MDAPGTVPTLIGAALHGRDGARAGTVVDLALDATGRPAWLVVRRAAGGCTLVPAGALRRRDGGFVAACTAEEVASAPVRVTAAHVPAGAEARRLRRHFAVLGVPDPASYLRAPAAARPLAAAS